MPSLKVNEKSSPPALPGRMAPRLKLTARTRLFEFACGFSSTGSLIGILKLSVPMKIGSVALAIATEFVVQ